MPKPYNWITFNDFNTLHFALIEDLPIVNRAEDDIEFIEVDGRHGFLTYDKKTKKPIDYSISLIVKDYRKRDVIKSNFKGSGKLILSNEPERYYKAVVTNTITFERQVRDVYEVVITFKLQPFAYDLFSKNITLTSSDIIYNYTNATAQPIIKVYGSGDGVLMINDNDIQIKEMTEPIILNFELEEAYNTSHESKNTLVLGEFEEFVEGNNVISWNGGITKIEITPNWRWQ